MFQVLCESYGIQQAIFDAIVCGDFLLAFILFALSLLLRQRREAAENAKIRKVLTGFPPDTPPDADTDEARRVRDAKEDAEAFQQLMNYSAADAYGGGDGG